MRSITNLTFSTSPQLQPTRKPRTFANLSHRQRFLYGRTLHHHTGKEKDAETGLYYYGARYLDPKTSRWISGDPAVGEYIPSAPVNEEARKRNGNLPGMGGVFNYVNLHVYHYAGNNPIKLVDPDGETPKYASLGNAINLDFGRDYMGLAEANFKEGEYGWAALMVVNATSEAIYDLLAAYVGASFIGAIATVGTVGTTGTVAGQKLIADSKPLFEKSAGHIFSRSHITNGIMNLGKSKEEIFSKLVNTVNNHASKAVEGSNEIRTKINGIATTIRFNVKDGNVQKIDAFIGESSRVVGNLIQD